MHKRNDVIDLITFNLVYFNCRPLSTASRLAAGRWRSGSPWANKRNLGSCRVGLRAVCCVIFLDKYVAYMIWNRSIGGPACFVDGIDGSHLLTGFFCF